MGLSPRVRGNRQIGGWKLGYAWVYPRVCGGTGNAAHVSIR